MNELILRTETVTDRIQEIESLTAKIYELLEKHPEKADEKTVKAYQTMTEELIDLLKESTALKTMKYEKMLQNITK